MKFFFFTSLLIVCLHSVPAQHKSAVGLGWAGNSINTVVFRKNAVVTHHNIQYVSYYDSSGYLVLAKRKLGTDAWQIKQTRYKGNIKDAHNSISIMVDGHGFLHVAWNHHGNNLHYSKSIEPGSLELTDQLPMVGTNETNVTYPEFYKLKNGDLLYLYRDGQSGKGNLILNRYDLRHKTWLRVQDNLIDGEGKRNAYWQACVDRSGVFHLSWVWRESSDVASNHDMCYAMSTDGGKTWVNTANKPYTMPINKQNANVIVTIPQNSELINSTSITTDGHGKPYIATYWRPVGTAVPQYHIIYQRGTRWQVLQVSNRKTAFTLSGAGTKRIPIARPQIAIHNKKIFIAFRDVERGNSVSVFYCKNLHNPNWQTIDLSNYGVGQWEPSFDTELWRIKKKLHLFVQKTGQGDGEETENIPPQMVHIVEWK